MNIVKLSLFRFVVSMFWILEFKDFGLKISFWAIIVLTVILTLLTEKFILGGIDNYE